MEKEISAGIIIYRKTNEGPKFLLLYHGHNYWNFPKGKLETGQKFIEGEMVQEREKSFHAAIREVREETGLGRNDIKFYGLFKASEQFTFWNWRQGKKVFKVVIFYLAETLKKDIKLSDEHEGFGWFLYKEAVKTLGNRKGNQMVLKQAFDALQKPIGAIIRKEPYVKLNSEQPKWKQQPWRKKFAPDRNLSQTKEKPKFQKP